MEGAQRQLWSIGIIAVAMSMATLSAGVHAEGIQRWVDERGKVHFGDRPPTHVQAEEVTVAPTNSIDSAAANASRDTYGRTYRQCLQQRGSKQQCADRAADAVRQERERQRRVAQEREQRQRQLEAARERYNASRQLRNSDQETARRAAALARCRKTGRC